MSFRIDQLAVLNLATVGNSITAGSFVRSGGTSSQFLKADGSVDSSAYITGITSGMVTTALGYTPVPTTRTLTINGVAQDLSTDRSWTISAGVSSVTGSGSGISVSPTTGAVVISNTGVTSNVAGTGISVSGATGAVTITNTGVTSIVAGTGISISGATGAVTVTNSGVTSVNGNTGAVTGIATTAQLASYLPLAGGTMTGVITTPNGTHGIIVGDDSRLADRNIANTLFVEGVQNNDRGYINFSSTTGNALGAINAGSLTWRGDVVLTSTNYNSYAPTLTGTGASGSWGISITGNSATTSQTNFTTLTLNSATVATQTWVTSQGYITSASVGNGTLTLAVSGTGLSGSASFTANQSANTTFTVTSNATNLNTASTIVARDASGNFSAGTITATLSGSATSVSNNFIIRADSGTTEGTDIYTFNGSAAKNINFVGGSNITITKAAGQWTIAASQPTVNNGTLTLAVAGTGLSGSATFTANQSGNSTFTVTSNATSANTASTIVARDASGNFTAGTITAALSGNATTASTWQTARTITIGSTGKSVDGSGNVSWSLTEIGAPSTTGTGASGTWGINITGNSATTSQTNFSNLTIGGSQVWYNSGSWLGDLGSYGFTRAWGLSMVGGAEFVLLYKSGQGYTLVDGSYYAYEGGGFYSSNNSAGNTLLGFYADTTSSVNFNTGTVKANGNTILHAGNYNSYAPTLTGGGASGTWGINITGNAATATNADTLDGLDSTDFMRNYGMLNNTDVYVNFRVMRNSNTSSANDGMYIGYGNTNGGLTRIFGGGATTGELIKYSNYTYEPGSFRAPIFYDSDNTGFYLDPNNTGTSLNVAGRMTGASWTTTGRNYSNEWIEFPNHSGLYSPLNGAHFYPNNATFGSWRVAGSRNGWSGFEFDASNGQVCLMINPNSNQSGIHNNSYGWQFFWSSGILYVYKNAYGGGTQATVWDSVNAPRASNSNLMYYQSFTLDANTMDSNATGFTYAVNAPVVGPIVRFSTGGSYDMWLHGAYSGGGNQFYLRTRNGDSGTLNAWREIITSGNIASQQVTSLNSSNFIVQKGTFGNWNADFQNTPAGSLSYGGDVGANGSLNPGGSWWMQQNFRHTNSSNFWGVQVAWGWEDNANRLATRNVTGGSFGGWVYYLNSANYTSWAIARGGDTVDGLIYFRTNLGAYLGSLSSGRLQAYNDNNQSAFMSFHRSGQYAVNFGLDQDNVMRIGGWSAAANRWQLDMSGNMTVAGDVTAYSDARVKENIVTVENALDKVLNLRGVYYNRTDSDDKRRKVGVIAQEIMEVIPEVVAQDNEGMYNVSYGNIVGVLIEAIKEQQKQIDELKAKLDGTPQ